MKYIKDSDVEQIEKSTTGYDVGLDEGVKIGSRYITIDGYCNLTILICFIICALLLCLIAVIK